MAVYSHNPGGRDFILPNQRNSFTYPPSLKLVYPAAWLWHGVIFAVSSFQRKLSLSFYISLLYIFRYHAVVYLDIFLNCLSHKIVTHTSHVEGEHI
jgi:hypothetical protein